MSAATVVSLSTRRSRLVQEVLRGDVVTYAYVQLGLDRDPEMSLLDQARVLETHFLLHTPAARVGDCEECKGSSDVTYPGCPFCGDVEDTLVTPERAHALDDAVQEVVACKRSMAEGAWKVGQILLRVRADKLWRARVGDDGARRWKTFRDFVSGELGLSIPWAYELMDAARVFPEEDVKTVGASKLARILYAPKEQRDALLVAARAGASRRELEQRIAHARAELPPGPMRAKTLHMIVPDGVEWGVPLLADTGRGRMAPAMEVGSRELVGGAAVAANARISLKVMQGPDGTLQAVVRFVRTKPAPRNAR